MNSSHTMGTPQPALGLKVAYTGTAGTTSAVAATTTVIRVISTTDCFIEIGAAPTAVADTGMYLPALVPEYFACKGSDKVSAIQVASGGTIYVSQMT